MCGFGEIARNFSRRLAAADVPGVHFIFIIPKRHIGELGDGVSYVAKERRRIEIAPWVKKIDLWHTTDQQLPFRVRGPHIISLLTIHDLNYLHEKRGLHLLRHIVEMKWKVMHSTAATCISEYVRGDVKRNIGLGHRDYGVIHNAIGDLEKGEQQRPAFAEEGDKFLFTVGQIRRKKNFASLVPMMRYLRDYKLFIAGDDHFADAQELREVIAAECPDRVKLCGKISDAEKCWLYAHAAAFVFPSRLEGFGIPPLEAMRFHCPVISSSCTSLPEVCGSHVAYFPDFEPRHMASVVKERIDTWSKDSAEANEAAEYSRGFNYDAYTEAYIRLYLKLLAEAK